MGCCSVSKVSTFEMNKQKPNYYQDSQVQHQQSQIENTQNISKIRPLDQEQESLEEEFKKQQINRPQSNTQTKDKSQIEVKFTSNYEVNQQMIKKKKSQLLLSTMKQETQIIQDKDEKLAIEDKFNDKFQYADKQYVDSDIDY